jgi:DNA polymerase sigma
VPSLRPLPPRNGGCRFETAVQKIRRRIPYSIGDEKLEKSDLSKIQSSLSEDDERKLTTDMRELYDRLKPTPAVEEKRLKLVQKLEKMLNDAWPGCNIRVNLFGSSGNMLCTDDSDGS